MSEFIKNILKLVSGNLVAQLIGVLLIPIIARLYSPEDVGLLQIFLSISTIVTIFSCLSYQTSIMLPKEEEDSANIFALCVLLIIITSGLCGLVVSINSDWIERTLNAPELSSYLIFLPFFIFLNGNLVVMNYWLSRKSQFSIIAGANVSNSLFCKVIQIKTKIEAISIAPGLIIGILVGYAIADLFMLRWICKDARLLEFINHREIIKMAYRYKNFPIYSSWSTVANEISLQAPSFMLSMFFSPTIVGFYSIAFQAVSLPMNFLGSAVAQVFFQKASEEKNRTGSIKYIVEQVHQRLIAMVLFPMLILMIISEELFGFVFGSKWDVSGLYVKLLIPWILIMFISSPLTSIFCVLEKQHYGLLFDLILLLSRLISLYIGGIYGDPLVALALFSITGAVFCGIKNLIILKLAGVSVKEEFVQALRFLILAVLAVSPVLLAKILTLNIYILISLSILMAMMYYGIITLNDPSLKQKFFKKKCGINIVDKLD